MKPPRLFLSAVALISMLAMVGCTTPSADVAATVNGTVITNAQVQRLEPAFRMLVEKSGRNCDPSAPPPAQGAPPPPSVSCDSVVLGQLIQAALLAPYAEQHKITASATDVNSFVTGLQNQVGGQAGFDSMLADAGVSLQVFRELARIAVFAQNVQADFDKATSEADLQAAYETDKAQFTTIDTAHILVKSEAQAQKIKDEATTKNFADLAKKYSTDPGSADKGGDLGPIPASSLVAEYSDAVLAAKPGEIIGPVKSQFGYHVIWVKGIDVKPFDQVKDQLAQNSQGQAFATWMGDEMTKADVEVNPRYGRLDVATGQIVPIDSTAATPSAEAGQNQP